MALQKNESNGEFFKRLEQANDKEIFKIPKHRSKSTHDLSSAKYIKN